MTPMGTLKHRHYKCPATAGERAEHAPQGLVYRATLSDDADIALERAFMPSILHTVPRPSKVATFKWILRPPNGTFKGTVYSDGSRLDGPSAVLARNGWAFVVIDDLGNVIAIAAGVPPDWVEDIPATEAWDLLEAAIHAEPGCTSMVDCKPCVDAVHKGPAAARSEKNPHARVHMLMHLALDEVPASSVIWMPSHCKKGQAGTVIRGDGFLLTETNIEINDVADTHAKRAVEQHRVPSRKRAEIKAHDEATTQNALWIARATLLANDQEQPPHRDTEVFRERAIAAGRERRKAKAEQLTLAPAPQGIDPQTGQATQVRARTVAEGGHELTRVAGGWWCMVCRTASAKWAKLAPQECKGHATDRWTNTARLRGYAKEKPSKQHCLVVSGPVVWCTTCGAHACAAPLLLAQPCRGRPAKSTARAMYKQLKRLQSGIHPETRKAIHLPIPIEEWKASLAQRRTQLAALGEQHEQTRAPPAIADDGTAFTQAFLRRGRTESSTASTSIERIRARLKETATSQLEEHPKKAKTSGAKVQQRLRASTGVSQQREQQQGTSATKRAALTVGDFLTEAERADSELVGFWIDSSSDSDSGAHDEPSIEVPDESSRVSEGVCFFIVPTRVPARPPPIDLVQGRSRRRRALAALP